MNLQRSFFVKGFSKDPLAFSGIDAKVGLLHDRWWHHLSPPPQFRHGTGGEGNILHPPSPVVSAATARKTFGHTDLTSTYSVCTWRIFGGIEHRAQALWSGVRCSNPVIPKVVYMAPPGVYDDLQGVHVSGKII
ncbi:uncharacterized protein TNCV_4969311 [Trichonephila clavipes]|nr:uncharacterized protein TNCV_4969311 [Trichonephila clavipes]